MFQGVMKALAGTGGKQVGKAPTRKGNKRFEFMMFPYVYSCKQKVTDIFTLTFFLYNSPLLVCTELNWYFSLFVQGGLRLATRVNNSFYYRNLNLIITQYERMVIYNENVS